MATVRLTMGSSGILADHDRRLAVFEAQPSGLTAVTVNDEVVTLLRRGDPGGLRELLRGERREYAERLTGVVQHRRQEQATAALVIENATPSSSAPTASLGAVIEFDVVMSVAHGLRQHTAVARWTMWGEQYADAFARELHDDDTLRTDVAEAVGVSLEEFDTKAPDALKAAHHQGDWPERGAITILETGTSQ
jgi:hypothetical protein